MCVGLCFGKTTIEQNPDLVAQWADRWRGYPARAVFHETSSWIGKDDLSQKVAAIDVPVLIVHGDEDAVLPVERAKPMLDVLPNARLALIPEAGHTANLENAPAVNEAMRGFLREVYGR